MRTVSQWRWTWCSHALILCLLGCQSQRSAEETRFQEGSGKQTTACLRAFAGAGGGNPNRIDLAGEYSNYVKYIATRPLQINENPAMDTPSTAYSSQFH